MTFLEATTKPPPSLDPYDLFIVDGILVHACLPRAIRPHELRLSMEGWRRRHPVASWDGCAFVV